MATTYTDQNRLISDTTFRGRVQVSLITETNGIYSEAVGTPNHSARIKLADYVLQAPDSVVLSAMPVLLTNTDISGSAPDGTSLTDGTLQAVVGASWNNIAKNLKFT